MQGKRKWLRPGLIVLSLALSLAGCAQTPTIIFDDSGNYRKHEQQIMVPEASGQSTDQSLRMDMEGGG
jgi:hypothetical protein